MTTMTMSESAVVESVAPAVTRDSSPEMSMAEFVQWMGVNFGTLSVSDALQQAAFMLCCDVIAQDIAKAPLLLRERLENGTSKIVMPRAHPIAGMLALEPNERHTWYSFSEMLVLWLCLTRNGFAYCVRDNFGDPVSLIPLQSGHVMEQAYDRDIFYDISAATWQEQALLGFATRRVPARDMLHVRIRMLDGMDGYSTLIAGRTTLETGKSLESFRDDLFAEGGQLRGVFQKDGTGTLDDKAFQRLRMQLRILMNRFKDGSEPVVLEDGLKFQAISSKPSEMELTAQFQQQILSTGRLLRVPPHKLFQLDGSKYSNLETAEKTYVGDTLVPIAISIEQHMAKTLLSRKDRLRFFFQYDRDAMTVRDTTAETDRAVRALERAGITFDEFRARLGYNPFPNGQGEARLVPVNMSIVDLEGQVVVGGAATPAQDIAGGETPAANTSNDGGEDDSAPPKKALRVVASN